MDNPIVKRLMEKYRETLLTESVDYKDKIEKILAYRLGSYETGVSVSHAEKVGETPTEISFRVEYEVDIRVPVGYDPETNSREYEYDTEYRRDILVLKKEELTESLTSEEDADLISALVSVRNNAVWVINKYQELEDMEECKSILQKVISDSQRALDLISEM